MGRRCRHRECRRGAPRRREQARDWPPSSICRRLPCRSRPRSRARHRRSACGLARGPAAHSAAVARWGARKAGRACDGLSAVSVTSTVLTPSSAFTARSAARRKPSSAAELRRIAGDGKYDPSVRDHDCRRARRIPEAGSSRPGRRTLANAAMISSLVSMAQTSERGLTIGAALHKQHRIVRAGRWRRDRLPTSRHPGFIAQSPRRDGNHAPEQGPGGMSTAYPCVTGVPEAGCSTSWQGRGACWRALRATLALARAVLAIALAGLALAHQALVDPARAAQEEKPLVLLTEAAHPPYAYLGEKGEMVGFEIDLMNAICARIKRTCLFKHREFDRLVPSLLARKGRRHRLEPRHHR